MLEIPHEFPFDPRYGYDIEALRTVEGPGTEPQDFDAFWQNLYQETLQVPLNLERKAFPVDLEDWQVEEVYFDTLNNVRVGAWLVTPKHDPVHFLRVLGHGYGGREGCNVEEYIANTAHLFPVAPGFHISASEDLPLNDAGKHVIHGIDSKDTYIFRECAASLWSAASVLIELYPEQAESLHYRGWSYGGGMGAIMLPWDKRYVCAELGQPSFGHHPIRLGCQCVGSGESVRLYSKEHPEIIDSVLPYFDAATHATKITQPVLWVVCAFDPAVPPPGQHAVANACTSEKQIFEMEVGHYGEVDYPGRDENGLACYHTSIDFFNRYVMGVGTSN